MRQEIEDWKSLLVFEGSVLPKGCSITEEDLVARTPPAVLELLIALVQEVVRLRKRVEELESKLGQDSSNSNKSPLSDSPYKEKKKKKSSKRQKKKRKGYCQKLMDPTEIRKTFLLTCSCGCNVFSELRPYYTHQHIELPEIVMNVTHFILRNFPMV